MNRAKNPKTVLKSHLTNQEYFQGRPRLFDEARRLIVTSEYTQQQIADMCNFSRSTIQNIAYRTGMPGADVVQRVYEVLSGKTLTF